MKKILFLIAFLFFIPLAKAQIITVSATEYTHEELVTEVLINSPCAIVNKPVVHYDLIKKSCSFH